MDTTYLVCEIVDRTGRYTNKYVTCECAPGKSRKAMCLHAHSTPNQAANCLHVSDKLPIGAIIDRYPPVATSYVQDPMVQLTSGRPVEPKPEPKIDPWKALVSALTHQVAALVPRNGHDEAGDRLMNLLVEAVRSDNQDEK